MGWNTVGLRVSASLSNHNSEQDKQDEALWNELRDRIGELCADPKYSAIIPTVF